MKKRATGVLEAEILAALSVADEPMSPAALREAIGNDVTYSTVTTILARLIQKGQVTRVRTGRRYDYILEVEEADLAASQMYDRLRRSGDRVGVLRRFVTELGPDEAVALRDLLGEEARP